jgi:hypothetical protein
VVGDDQQHRLIGVIAQAHRAAAGQDNLPAVAIHGNARRYHRLGRPHVGRNGQAIGNAPGVQQVVESLPVYVVLLFVNKVLLFQKLAVEIAQALFFVFLNSIIRHNVPPRL